MNKEVVVAGVTLFGSTVALDSCIAILAFDAAIGLLFVCIVGWVLVPPCVTVPSLVLLLPLLMDVGAAAALTGFGDVFTGTFLAVVLDLVGGCTILTPFEYIMFAGTTPGVPFVGIG